MPRLLLALLLLAPVAFAAGRWSSAGDEPGASKDQPVRALRYRIVWADSALDLTHGGGRWVHELFFPDLKVTATIVHETEYAEGEALEIVRRPRVYVWPAEAPRTNLTGLHASGTEVQPEVAEVLVPAEVARAVEAFAKLSRRYRAEGTRVGAELADALDLEPMDASADPASEPDVE